MREGTLNNWVALPALDGVICRVRDEEIDTLGVKIEVVAAEIVPFRAK